MQLSDYMELRFHPEGVTFVQVDGQRKTVPYEQANGFHKAYTYLLDQYAPDKRSRTADFSLDWQGERWRGHIFHHACGWSLILRRFPREIPNLDDLDIDPAMILSLARGTGLTVIIGPTAAGKSTTLAAVLRALEAEGIRGETITIESPVEYYHDDWRIQQREVGRDVETHAEGVIQAMRQTPDTIVIGEIREADAASAAVRAGLTGHRVLTTLHGDGVIDGVSRLMSVVDERYARLLESSLQGFFAQNLIAGDAEEGSPAQPPVIVYESLLMDKPARSLLASDSPRLQQLTHEMARQHRPRIRDQVRMLYERKLISEATMEAYCTE